MLFDKKEYKERLNKVKDSMQKLGIELLVSHDPANMNYLTGYDAWSFYYAQCVLVHINEEEPICFLRAQDAGGGYIKTYVQHKNIIPYEEKYIHTTWSRDIQIILIAFMGICLLKIILMIL